MFIDSPAKHAFTFTPSFSFFVETESEDELRRLAAALGEGGSVMMPLGDYGFSRLFTWVSDRFGVSWQLNLP
jgi:predicted 3-demethylubiquinone-9 3-methyltransferase (glyoxalase superfamily)